MNRVYFVRQDFEKNVWQNRVFMWFLCKTKCLTFLIKTLFVALKRIQKCWESWFSDIYFEMFHRAITFMMKIKLTKTSYFIKKTFRSTDIYLFHTYLTVNTTSITKLLLLLLSCRIYGYFKERSVVFILSGLTTIVLGTPFRKKSSL